MNSVLTRGLAILVALLLVAAAPAPAEVTIDNFSFNPARLSVPVGTEVHWTNRDDIPHTVTSADAPRPFGSRPLDTDGDYSHRFDHAGTFAYFCALHAHMQGVVIVR